MKDAAAWYVLIGDQKYGPYKYKKIIHLLQSKQLMDFNYVWAEHLKDWTPIYQLEEFSKQHLDYLLKKEPEYASTFISRQYKRVSIKIPVIGHNSMKFFTGEFVSISEGGGLCLLDSAHIEIGENLKMHLESPTDNSEKFTAEGVILRKNYSVQMLKQNSGLYYAVKFHEISSQLLEQIRTWSQAA